MNFLKTGAAAVKALEEENKKIAAREAESGKLYRFWVDAGEEARITFVDGELGADGLGATSLSFVAFYEHNLQIGGKWGNHYVCLQSEGGVCPICEEGDNPSFAGAFTIIDHRSFVSKKNGQTYSDQKRLFVAPSRILTVLQSIAVKRGGLAGCTFDVMRATKKDARVGSSFDFLEKNPIPDLQAAFTETVNGKEVTYFTPADYLKELPYHTESALRAMGFGVKGISSKMGGMPHSSVLAGKGKTAGGDSVEDYSGDL